jgi:hypothetical protein
MMPTNRSLSDRIETPGIESIGGSIPSAGLFQVSESLY